jgi:hypothetical protein
MSILPSPTPIRSLLPSSEWRLHYDLYRAFTDAKAVGILPYAFLLPPPILLRLSSSSPDSNLLQISIIIKLETPSPSMSYTKSTLTLFLRPPVLPWTWRSHIYSYHRFCFSISLPATATNWVGNSTFQLHGGSSRRSCLHSQFLNLCSQFPIRNVIVALHLISA